MMEIRRVGDYQLTGDRIKLYFFQCFTCGLLGFEEFFMMDNLMDAMGWQLSNGCFGDNFFAASELDNGDKVPEGNLSTIQTFSKDKRSLPLTTR